MTHKCLNCLNTAVGQCSQCKAYYCIECGLEHLGDWPDQKYEIVLIEPIPEEVAPDATIDR